MREYDGYVTSSAGYTPAIAFMSASSLGSYGSAVSGQKSIFGTSTDYASNTLQFIQNDFVGLNVNIYEPLSCSVAIANVSSSENTLGYATQIVNSSTDFNYKGGMIASLASDADTGNKMLSTLIHHRQGPYGNPTWKQIRTGEHPVAKFLRKNNQLSILHKIPIQRASDLHQSGSGITPRTISNYRSPFQVLRSSPSHPPGTSFSMAEPGSPIDLGIAGKAREEQLEREYQTQLFKNEIRNYAFSPATTKYSPLLQTVFDLAGNQVIFKHAYGNNIEYMPNDLLDELLGTKANMPLQHHDTLVKRIVVDKSLQFGDLVYKESVFPRERNQFLARTRGRGDYSSLTRAQLADTRLGQQRIFWRDSIKDRTLTSISASGNAAGFSHKTSGSGESCMNSLGYRQYFNITFNI